MPSVRALWKIVLCQISSLVKYRQNKTNEASASALSSATSFGTTINSWIKYNLNNTTAELSEMLNNCSILLFVRNDKEIECKKVVQTILKGNRDRMSLKLVTLL